MSDVKSNNESAPFSVPSVVVYMLARLSGNYRQATQILDVWIYQPRVYTLHRQGISSCVHVIIAVYQGMDVRTDDGRLAACQMS